MYLQLYSILGKSQKVTVPFPRDELGYYGRCDEDVWCKVGLFLLAFSRAAAGIPGESPWGRDSLHRAALGVWSQCMCCLDVVEHVDFTTENHVQHVHSSRG